MSINLISIKVLIVIVSINSLTVQSASLPSQGNTVYIFSLILMQHVCVTPCVQISCTAIASIYVKLKGVYSVNGLECVVCVL